MATDRKCCVKNCGSRSHDPRGRMLQNGLTFHCFPAWRTNEGDFVSELTRRRRAAWVSAVGRRDISFACIPSSMRVCSRHFLSGKPAFEMLDLDPDWAPSLHLGHNGEGNGEKGRRAAADGPDSGLGLGKPAPPPWREVKSALQTLLREKPNMGQQNRREPKDGPAETSFRDFFRKALESSLEASIQSRARSKNRSSSTEYQVKLNFQLPPTRKESGSCENCSQLRRRIQDLERQLFQIASKQNTEGLEVWIQPDQNQQSSEEEQETRMGHLSPGEVRVDDSYVVLDSEMAPISPDSSDTESSLTDEVSASTRSRPRFQSGWLETFPFLRYSSTQDLMWCHVCRFYADDFQRNHSLIKGTDRFLKFGLTSHSKSLYHQENMKRYRASSGSGV